MRELVLCPMFIPVPSALVAQQVTAQDFVDALRNVAKVAVFSPNPWFFAFVLGNSVRDWGILALALEFPGCTGGVAF